jgi:hypothetical protein
LLACQPSASPEVAASSGGGGGGGGSSLCVVIERAAEADEARWPDEPLRCDAEAMVTRRPRLLASSSESESSVTDAEVESVATASFWSGA